MSVQAYRTMLIAAVKQGKISQRKAKIMFNQYLESQLKHTT